MLVTLVYGKVQGREIFGRQKLTFYELCCRLFMPILRRKEPHFQAPKHSI